MNIKTIKGIRPSHPGVFIREDILPHLINPVTGKRAKKVEVAEAIGVSRQQLDNILNEKTDITPEMAVRFGKLFGNGAEFWVNLQAQYDLRIAAEKVDVDNIPTFAAAAVAA